MTEYIPPGVSRSSAGHPDGRWTRHRHPVITVEAPMLDSVDGGRRRDVSTRVSETPHGALGLTIEDVLSMYRTILTARLIDEAALRQNRMGRAPFVVPVSGHEGCQIGTAWAMRRGTDIWLPYYRDLRRGARGRDDPVRGLPGRSSPRPTIPPRAGARCRRTGAHGGSASSAAPPPSPRRSRTPPASRTRSSTGRRTPWSGCWFGDGATSEGDWHEGLNFAGDPPVAGDLRLREQPVRDQRPAVQADGRGGRRATAPRATGSPAWWSTGTTCSRATAP